MTDSPWAWPAVHLGVRLCLLIWPSWARIETEVSLWMRWSHSNTSFLQETFLRLGSCRLTGRPVHGPSMIAGRVSSISSLQRPPKSNRSRSWRSALAGVHGCGWRPACGYFVQAKSWHIMMSHGLHESWQGRCQESFRIHGQLTSEILVIFLGQLTLAEVGDSSPTFLWIAKVGEN